MGQSSPMLYWKLSLYASGESISFGVTLISDEFITL